MVRRPWWWPLWWPRPYRGNHRRDLIPWGRARRAREAEWRRLFLRALRDYYGWPPQ